MDGEGLKTKKTCVIGGIKLKTGGFSLRAAHRKREKTNDEGNRTEGELHNCWVVRDSSFGEGKL